MSGQRIVVERRWDRHPPEGGTAVVIDVIRLSTTLCALLQAGRRRVQVAQDPRTLLSAADLSFSDVFSEMDFRSPGRRFDNSPHQILSARGQSRRAYVTTTTGTKALWACRRASRVLVGCFANFDAVLRRLKRARGRVLLVPASPGADGGEDSLCAQALREALAGRGAAAEEALAGMRGSPRIAEFLRFRPRWGEKDLCWCLGLNRLPVVPEALFPAPGADGSGLARIRRAR